MVAWMALTTVWDGVYTAEQAMRGNAAYNTTCAACHRTDLGGGEARPLVGTKFWESWGEDSLDSLYSVVRERMPASNPGSLDDRTALDIVAYILQRNELPAGTTALTREGVRDIQVVGRDGPKPVPNFALVRIVGCLEATANGGWRITGAGEPARTREPAASRGAERERSLRAPRGTGVFELMDAYDEPQGHAGQKVEVKGLLMRGAPDRVNFSSMQQLDTSCAR